MNEVSLGVTQMNSLAMLSSSCCLAPFIYLFIYLFLWVLCVSRVLSTVPEGEGTVRDLCTVLFGASASAPVVIVL